MTDTTTEHKPTTVLRPSGVAEQVGDIRHRWWRVEPKVWTARMLTALERGVKEGTWPMPALPRRAVLLGDSHAKPVRQSHVRPHQLESRMREIRLSGSEGGGELPLSPYPYQELSPAV